MTPQYIEIDQLGNKFYRKDKAMTILHREDGPAVEGYDGDKAWYINGKRHREDGPAIEWWDGSKSWYLNGKRHREDGPAIYYTDGHKSWHLNGKLHREDGPAIEWNDGSKAWYLNGEKLTEQEFLKRTGKEIILTMDEIAAKFGIEVSKLKIAK
jgi:hypothetical protein